MPIIIPSALETGSIALSETSAVDGGSATTAMMAVDTREEERERLTLHAMMAVDTREEERERLTLHAMTRHCPRCNVWTDKDVYHCRHCDACIEGYDHHCPWTSKCIGAKNMRLFMQFNAAWLSLLITSFVALYGPSMTKP